jgi:arsenate reductase (glutaredoxin)
MLQIYHNPRCTKSRETLERIKLNGADIKIVEYLKEGINEDSLKLILMKLNIKPIELIRKGETIYKEKLKGLNLTDDEWIKVMVENPILIERPIVVKGNKAIIGRPPSNVDVLLN